MEKTQITIIINGTREQATLKHDASKGIIKFSMRNGFRKQYEASDLYRCLAKIREDHPDIVFLCKGAKLNVTPSTMCSQMSGGIIAYELKPGKSATFDDIVQIFAYEEENLSRNLEEQQAYYKEWVALTLEARRANRSPTDGSIK
ncbi:hypothetical protein HU755_17580 [Pseudomonas sp. SWRI111]|uniref:hypothetical protein n=1 Tax=Pseudomonas sp. SWRI111 TaxID=2745507 RepID=UPI0016496E38|nr:hypothetical protein [Pseudomonas sp. SWRI111]MBC3208616.1 hypothetical protein [Pseudomonas sp. SWRI111]